MSTVYKVAHIQCLTSTFQIPDLGLSMIKGQVVVREEAIAKGSEDLKHGIRVGAVQVRYVQKAQQQRPASNTGKPVTAPQSRPVASKPRMVFTNPGKFVPANQQPVVTKPPPALDEEKLAKKIRAGVMEDLQPLIQSLKDSVKPPDGRKGKKGDNS